MAHPAHLFHGTTEGVKCKKESPGVNGNKGRKERPCPDGFWAAEAAACCHLHGSVMPNWEWKLCLCCRIVCSDDLGTGMWEVWLLLSHIAEQCSLLGRWGSAPFRCFVSLRGHGDGCTSCFWLIPWVWSGSGRNVTSIY